MKKDLSSQHTFAVCAYKESAYLRACLESLRNQTMKSRIVLATSTPSDFLRNLAEEFRIDYRVNPEQGRGIAADWNFALSCAETAYCTIAHQDDLYLPDYAERVVRALARHQDSLIAFTDYADRVMPEDVVRGDRFYLWIKRFLLLPFMHPQKRGACGCTLHENPGRMVPSVIFSACARISARRCTSRPATGCV